LFATFAGPARAVQFARSARSKVNRLGLRARTGLHTGECELIGRKIGGLTVDVAARIASLASPDEVLLSSTVKDLIAGSRLQFADRGTHALDFVPGEPHLYRAQMLRRCFSKRTEKILRRQICQNRPPFSKEAGD
jgi:class 3 adenylate cyclase